MTPDQIALVEDTLASVDLDELAQDFYRRAFALDPALSEMFTTDPAIQRARFAAELTEIVQSIRSLDTLSTTAQALGARHRSYGVHAVHYRLMGTALLETLAATAGDDWTPEAAEAWTLAYNLMAEMMMMGGLAGPAPD